VNRSARYSIRRDALYGEHLRVDIDGAKVGWIWQTSQ
jgi:hypothetical protein